MSRLVSVMLTHALVSHERYKQLLDIEQRLAAAEAERDGALLRVGQMRMAICALVARSPFFVSINHGHDDIETCQFCLEDGTHSASCEWPPVEALATPPDAAASALMDAAQDLSETQGALLAHFRRHTTHRCEIDRDADLALAAWRRAAAAGSGSEEGASGG